MNSNPLTIRRAQVPVALLPSSFVSAECDPANPVALCDVTIRSGKISAINEPGLVAAGDIDAEGRLVFPAFVEAHTHLDRAHTLCRAPNRSHTFTEALAAMAEDQARQTSDDIRLRADFALRCAWAHGTRLLRTHVVGNLGDADARHALMAEMRETWSDRLTLQTVALCGGGDYATSRGERLAEIALRHGASALGGFFVMSSGLPQQIDRLLAIAREHRIGIDLHVDETGDANSECLRVVAEAVLRLQFDLPVVCGHCCSLSQLSVAHRRETIALVKAAGIGVIALPLCNLYLQDRRLSGSEERAPQWRGLAPVLDLLAAGVRVACASDNVRDAFCPFGDLDPLEVYVQSVRLAHLDADLANSVRVVTSTAADLLGRPEFGRVAPGAPAQLVVFEARSFSELLSRPAAGRRCVDDGELRVLPVPDFAELRAAGLMNFSPRS